MNGNKKINPEAISIFFSALFLIAIVSAYIWLWGQSKLNTAATSAAENYDNITITSEKQDVVDYINSRTNFGSIPLQAPSSDQVGRDNPFAGL